MDGVRGSAKAGGHVGSALLARSSAGSDVVDSLGVASAPVTAAKAICLAKLGSRLAWRSR